MSFFNFLSQVLQTSEEDEAIDPESISLTYITDRVIAMGFPFSDDAVIGQPTIDRVSRFLRKHHAGRFMIWNISEQLYDYSKFDDNVIEFKFPGYPSPPLHQIFSICDAIDSWLRADEKNVAAIHCQTGTGRTYTLMSCYLAWMRQFHTPQKALAHILRARHAALSESMIPSQMRYIEYFNHIMQNRLPSGRPVTLQRIVMNGIPTFGDNETCRPYLQIFKNAKMVFSSTWSAKTVQSYDQSDGSVLFPVNTVLDGDILVRIRHLAKNNDRISMLRFGFHTGFVRPGNLRMNRHDLDGACVDERFTDDFLIDLIFTAPVDEHGDEIINGEFDAAFWKQVTTRTVPEVEAKKIVSNANNFALFEDEADADLHGALDAEAEAQAAMRSMVRNDAAARRTTAAPTFSSQYGSSGAASASIKTTSVSRPTPAPVAAPTVQSPTADGDQSLDDLEKYIKNLGPLNLSDGAIDDDLLDVGDMESPAAKAVVTTKAATKAAPSVTVTATATKTTAAPPTELMSPGADDDFDLDDSQLLASIQDQLRGLDDLSDDDAAAPAVASSTAAPAAASRKKLDDILDELP